MKKIQKATLNNAKELARQIAKELKGGEILALIGELGSGKTTFAKALGKELKVKRRITSPTFTLMHALPARLPRPAQNITLYHLDLYRTSSFSEVKALGITEAWGQKNTVNMIEWADKIKRYLPKKTSVILFKHKRDPKNRL
jgi:tRNA threonylcarbamoyladenosine biosynthesis protein TsaE